MGTKGWLIAAAQRLAEGCVALATRDPGGGYVLQRRKTSVKRMLPLLAALAFARGASASSLPEQFHIALAGDGETRISFKLNSSAPQTCTYSWAGHANTTSAPSTVRGYFPGRGFYHHVLLSNLSYSTLIFYACAGGPLLSFKSPPPTASFTPFSMAVFGDWGYLGSNERGPSLPVGGLSANWSAVPVRELMEGLAVNDSVQMVLHAGDIGYYDDCFGEDLFKFCYENVTDGWFNWIQNVSSKMPYQVAAGNHESTRETQAASRCWRARLAHPIVPLRRPSRPPLFSPLQANATPPRAF